MKSLTCSQSLNIGFSEEQSSTSLEIGLLILSRSDLLTLNHSVERRAANIQPCQYFLSSQQSLFWHTYTSLRFLQSIQHSRKMLDISLYIAYNVYYIDNYERVLFHMKCCSKCGDEYPATPEFFVRDVHTKDGLCPQCKTCRKAWTDSHKEQREQFDLSKAQFTPEQLRECYIEKHMNQRAIANHFHVDVRKVRYAMKEWGIPTRENGWWLKQNPTRTKYNAGLTIGKRGFSIDRYPFTEDELRDLLAQNVPLAHIANKYGTTLNCVRYAARMIEYKPKERKAGEPVSYLVWHYDDYTKAAFLRKHSFELTEEEFEEIVRQPCYYCGLPPSSKVGREYFSGIDRIDSKHGYIKGNVRPCCGNCNMGKRLMPERDFYDWVLRTADYIRANNLNGGY